MPIDINKWGVGSSNGMTTTGYKPIDQAVSRFNALYTSALIQRIGDLDLINTGNMIDHIRGEMRLNDDGYEVVVVTTDYFKYHNSSGFDDGDKISGWALEQPAVIRARERVEQELMTFLRRNSLSDVSGVIQESVPRRVIDIT
jgi:hypothetical protein